MALLPSDEARAFLSIDEATKPEQLIQIQEAVRQTTLFQQMLETSDIGSALSGIIGDGEDITRIIETVLGYEAPERFTRDYEVLSTEEYAALNKDRREYLEDLYNDIDELSARVALDENESAVMGEIASLSTAPQSDISATQAQILQDAAKMEQDKRERALQILRGRRDDIEKQLEAGAAKADQPAMACFWNSKKCGY